MYFHDYSGIMGFGVESHRGKMPFLLHQCSQWIGGFSFIAKKFREEVTGKKWIYLGKNILHRQSVKELQNMAWLVFMGWVTS